MYTFTEKDVSEIINDYIGLFDNIEPPQHIIVDENFECGGYGVLIGPIDDEYGLAINVKEFEFETKDAVIAIVLHELIHYYLLLKNKQPKKRIHNKEFIKIANELSEKTKIKGIMCDGWIGCLLREKGVSRNIMLIKQNGIWVVTTLKNENEFEYWDKYLKESIELKEFEDYKLFKSNRRIFYGIPLTKNKKYIQGTPIKKEDEYMFLNP